MSTFLLGSINIFSFDRIPNDWLPCDGRSLNINDYIDLYTVIETTFGGDGMTHFNLPNIQGRTVIGPGQGPGMKNYIQGAPGGNESVVLPPNSMPIHNHAVTSATLQVAGASSTGTPNNGYLAIADSTVGDIYADTVTKTNNNEDTMHPINGNTDASSGGQPVYLMNPYLSFAYCICVNGVRV